MDTALQLAQDTGMHYYDAELLRLRAQTHTDPEARRADLGAALDVARRQGATCSNCAPPWTISSYAVSPRAQRSLMPSAASPAPSAFPSLARARAALE